MCARGVGRHLHTATDERLAEDVLHRAVVLGVVRQLVDHRYRVLTAHNLTHHTFYLVNNANVLTCNCGTLDFCFIFTGNMFLDFWREFVGLF